ncbi:helix-turn-helix domain-containing protein [Saccharopolyspora sp. K220]|uniref:helix-turn-helix domain-containing protein n=1 Tax=Saccharopolyspora soli TaxID=2926618 RepID=UPI001F587D84|nr:helix-turn-helix domain-containing protein [Saccharopolyspora soli]MCI2422937.1 helix-turn-helix domain-containing protein [Saccharopolyspora soli]
MTSAQWAIIEPLYPWEVVCAFNEQGFAALDPKWKGGRRPRFGPVARTIICQVAKTPPQRLELPFTTRSLSKLVPRSG